MWIYRKSGQVWLPTSQHRNLKEVVEKILTGNGAHAADASDKTLEAFAGRREDMDARFGQGKDGLHWIFSF